LLVTYDPGTPYCSINVQGPIGGTTQIKQWISYLDKKHTQIEAFYIILFIEGNLKIAATQTLKITPANIAIQMFTVVYLPSNTNAASSKKCNVLISIETNPNLANADLKLNKPIPFKLPLLKITNLRLC